MTQSDVTHGAMGAGNIVPMLARLCATRHEIAFLRACLLDGEAARTAWARWEMARSRLPSPAGGPLPIERVFAGLLLRSATDNALPLGADLRVALRAHRLVESRRWDQYCQVLRRVLQSVNGPRMPLLARGGALAGRLYPAPGLRHVHDIDLLVPEAEIATVHAALLQAGFDMAGATNSRRHQAVRHPSGMLAWLHATPFHWPAFEIACETLEAEASTTIVAGVAARVLSSPHALLQACVSSLPSTRSPAALRWATDAWFLVADADEECWSHLVAAAHSCGLCVPLAVTLWFLARELDAPVPATVVEALAAEARREGLGAGRDLARLLRAGPRTVRELLEVEADWGARLRLAVCVAWPSRRYVEARRDAVGRRHGARG